MPDDVTAPQGTPPNGQAPPTEPPVTPPVTPPPTPQIPEKYEFKLGDGVELDPKAVETFTPVLKELGMTNEAAGKLAQAFTKELERQDSVLNELYGQQVSTWEKSSKEDKEYGGAQFDANLQVAQKALARFGSPELKSLLDQTGLGSHPEVLRLFWKLGATITEDTSVAGGTSATAKSLESLLFDHPTSQSMQ